MMTSGFQHTTRRVFLTVTASVGALGVVGSATAGAVDARMAESAVGEASRTDVRPYRIEIPDAALADMRQRVQSTRWPEKETVADDTQGVRLAVMRSLAQYWGTDYDWRRCEQHLNSLPNFVTEIDGLDIHFLNIRSRHADALPIIITHGWPGSVIEQLKLIGLLTDPTAHGGTAGDAFHVIIPSLPGHGFSGKPVATGWGPIRIATAWIVLMERLGYTRYVAQGGDWGNAVTEQMALLRPPGLLGIHTNMPATVPDDVARALQFGEAAPPDLTPDERQAFDQLAYFYKHGLGYANEMANRPQTLFALADSPVGLAAWMLDHDARSYALIARVFEGGAEGLSRQDVVDNVALYWLTNTAVSSARLYCESKLPFFAPKGVAIPVAVSAFPDELYQAPESWTRRAYSNLVFYKRHDRGGHYAAWEQPQLLSEDLREAFRPLRQA
jgi:pimeloyl-ACP methyl ester carboxylesterase